MPAASLDTVDTECQTEDDGEENTFDNQDSG